MKGPWKLLLLLPIMLLGFLGCAAEHAEIKENVAMPPPAIEKPEFVFHRVMPGETMATIARWYSGKESNWREIAEHNPELKPWALKKGDIVKVPVELATVHTEQPNYSTAPKKKKTTKGGGAAAAPAEDNVPPAKEEVFGPK